jgi:hypothetical protein
MAEQRLDLPEGCGPDIGTAEGCGCIAVAPATATEAPPNPPAPADSPDPTSVDSAPPVETPRRPLKLVATLQPAADGGYHVILALGSDGCDPLFRALDAPDLPAALADVPALLTEAQDRWQTQPRYPSAGPMAKSKPPVRTVEPTTPSAAGPPAAAPVVPAAPTPNVPVAPVVPPTRPASGQLSLFG